jgi:hypothetical protein
LRLRHRLSVDGDGVGGQRAVTELRDPAAERDPPGFDPAFDFPPRA